MDVDIHRSALFLIPALVAANAFFVAAEFALIALRRNRLEHLARDGDPRASRVLGMLHEQTNLGLAAQLGSTVSTLLLGFFLAALAADWAATAGAARMLGLPGPLDVEVRALAAAVAIVLVVSLHVVVGAQLPKLIGIHQADWIATRLTMRPLGWFTALVRPLLWGARVLLRLLSRRTGIGDAEFHPLGHTPEEIRQLVDQGHEQGVVEEDEREMISGVFEFSETVAREVMTPRTEMTAVPVHIGLDELLCIVAEEGHSRYPVYDGTPDSIVGVVLAKDLLLFLWKTNGTARARFDVRRIMREPYFVPDTKPVDDILAEFRQQRVHLAVVLDEFGGTYGIVTMEDLLEEIVGDINDEHDLDEPSFSPTPEGDVLIDGGTSISDVNERFGLHIPEEDFDTVGGFIFGALGRVPQVGDAVSAPGAADEARLHVQEVDERRVAVVRLARSGAVEAPVMEEA